MSPEPKFSLWTVYEHPLDFPHCYVARKFIDGQPTDCAIFCDELEMVRDALMRMGLACIGRYDGDEPQIVEVWV